MKKLLLFILLPVLIANCTNDYDTGILENFNKQDMPLKIYTKVLTKKSPNFMQEFVGGPVIGLYAISEKTGHLYNNNRDYKNVKASAFNVNDKLTWHQTPQIMLNTEPATLYAYYPYEQQVNFDPENIPVKISADASLSIDYMYGTLSSGQKAINRISPVALLDMNHALALLGFQVRLQESVRGCHLLNAVQIGNKAGGTALCFRGKMNIKTGAIGGCAGTNASTRLTPGSPLMLKKTSTDILQLMVIPTSRIQNEGDVEVLFIINGKTFKYKVPASTEWKKGNKYVYSLTFNGKTVNLDKISTGEWLPVKNKN